MTRKTTAKYYEEPIQKLLASEYMGDEVIQRIQERCEQIHNSSDPLFDAVKIAVYINCLIDLLKEQGFDYKHKNSFNRNEPDEFEITDLKSDKKVKFEICDYLEPFVIRNEVNEDSSKNEKSYEIQNNMNEETDSIISEEEVELMSGFVGKL